MGVIGGSGFYKLDELECAKEVKARYDLHIFGYFPLFSHWLICRCQVSTQWGEAKVVTGSLGGVDVVLLARHLFIPTLSIFVFHPLFSYVQ